MKNQWLLGFSLKIMPQVFSGETRIVKDSRQPQGQSDLGKLPLTETGATVSFFYLLCLSFNPRDLYNALFPVTIFVFITECQLVLEKPPVLSKPWVIFQRLWWEWWHHVFLPLRIYSQFCCLQMVRGQGMWLWCLVLGHSDSIHTFAVCLFLITVVN